MTWTDILSMPQGYTPEQWQKEINRRKRIENKLIKLSVDRDFCLDSYSMTGNEKFKNQLESIMSEIERLKKQLCGRK